MSWEPNNLVNGKFLLVIFLSIIVLTSGCSAIKGFLGLKDKKDNGRGFDYTPNDGLRINFKARKSKYYVTSNAGTPATFMLKLENTGEKEADIKSIYLEGAAWAAGQEISPPVTLMQGVNLVRSTRGEQRRLTKVLRIPKLSERRRERYYVGSVVKYGYSTTATSDVTLYPINSEERPTPTRIKTENTGAPIKVNMSGRSPMYVSNKVNFRFMLNNVGNGEVVGDIKLTLKTGSSIGGSTLIGQKTVPFFDGRVVSFSKSFGKINQRTDIKLILDAEYTYKETDGTEIIAERPSGS